MTMTTRFVLSAWRDFQVAEAGRNGLRVCLVGDGRTLNAHQMMVSRIIAITVIQMKIRHQFVQDIRLSDSSNRKLLYEFIISFLVVFLLVFFS